MKKTALFIFTLLLFFCFCGVTAAQSASVYATVIPDTFNITVTYSGAPGNARDWIGIYKVGAGNGAHISWQYLNGNREGSLNFSAPSSGTYDFRMFENDDYKLLATSNEVVIGQSTTTPSTGASLTATLNTSGSITVTYSGAPGNARDWIGIYKVGAGNGAHISWQYLNGNREGSLNFSAPSSGTYDFRMFENDDYKLLATSNEVVIGQSTTTPSTEGLNLKATPGDGKVYLSWNEASNTSGLIGYNLFRGVYSGGETSTPVTDFAIKGTSYADPNVSNGTYYCYVLRPVYADGTMGAKSNEACATPSGGGSSGGSGGGTTGGQTIVLQINNPYMTVNGASKEIDPGRGTVPTIINGRTLLPIRSIIETIGGTINWNESERKVTIQVKGTTIEMWIGNNNTRVNGINKTTDVAPRIINGRTMLPLRFIVENLGANVNWDAVNYKVTLNF